VIERREQVLAEMGITPLWHLREAVASVAEPVVDQPSTQREEPAPVPEVMPEIAPEAAPEVTHVASGSGIAQMGWPELAEVVRDCRACELCKARKQAVLGVGDVQADWLFVGEGPGAEEDERGEPFVGQAGKLLDAMLASIGIKRGEDVYIANAVKCRPPGNRTPEVHEIAACHPYLERQIALIRPRLIIALGRPAAQTLLNTEIKIGASRGRCFERNGIPVIVTYHPAYLLRNLEDKAKAWEDLCFAHDQMQALKAQ